MAAAVRRQIAKVSSSFTAWPCAFISVAMTALRRRMPMLRARFPSSSSWRITVRSRATMASVVSRTLPIWPSA